MEGITRHDAGPPTANRARRTDRTVPELLKYCQSDPGGRETLFDGVAGRGAASLDADLAVDGGEVGLDGASAEPEPGAYLLARESFGDQDDDVDLPQAQRCRQNWWGRVQRRPAGVDEKVPGIRAVFEKLVCLDEVPSPRLGVAESVFGDGQHGEDFGGVHQEGAPPHELQGPAEQITCRHDVSSLERQPPPGERDVEPVVVLG